MFRISLKSCTILEIRVSRIVVVLRLSLYIFPFYYITN